MSEVEIGRFKGLRGLAWPSSRTPFVIPAMSRDPPAFVRRRSSDR